MSTKIKITESKLPGIPHDFIKHYGEKGLFEKLNKTDSNTIIHSFFIETLREMEYDKEPMLGDDFIPNTTVKEYLAIEGGNHIGFIDERFASFAEWMGLDNSSGIEFKEQHRISCKFFTAWFKYHLNGSSEYYTYIFGNEAQNDLDTSILSDLKYKIQ